MGLPVFYRWLVNKYPKIVVPAREAKGDTRDPNPNGMEFDNLYLDLNKIIQPCFHAEDEFFPPTTFDGVFQSIFRYIDRVFHIVRPRKLLYIAIDGVAPRAKMNQKRSKCFLTSMAAEISEAEEGRLRREFQVEGKSVLLKVSSEVLDPHIVTAGTVFMEELSKSLQCFIRSQLNGDPGWKSIKVILSDSAVPGEGEHKIMKFMRLQRNLDNYDPNTRHCLYTQDADSILLALAVHEVHFSILREVLLWEGQQPNSRQPPDTSLSKDISGLATFKGSSENIYKTNEITFLDKKTFQFINIWTLREYLEIDMKISEPLFEIDFERIVDDFVFISFFIGNDFLPHIPSLDPREGAIDLLMSVYANEFNSRGGYLVNIRRVNDPKNGYLELKSVENFILSVGTHEERIFRKRMDLRQHMIKNAAERLSREKSRNVDLENKPLQYPKDDPLDEASMVFLMINSIIYGRKPSLKTLGSDQTFSSTDQSNVLENTMDLKKKLKDFMLEKEDLLRNGILERDKIRLDLPGWRERYYKEKFSAETPEDIENIRNEIVEKYTEGLCWLVQYYFFGVRSWNWFYPHYNGPFASDMKFLARVNIKFNMGSPFKPFDQLMAVLPPRSVRALPRAFWHLMTSQKSPLKEFYLTDFDVDVDGKRYLGQGIAKVPFIDEKRLFSETEKLEKELTKKELERNSEGRDIVFVLRPPGLGIQISNERRQSPDTNPSQMNRYTSSCNEHSVEANHSLYFGELEKPIEDNVICAVYECSTGHAHIPHLLKNVTIPEKIITGADIRKQPLWHDYKGLYPPKTMQIHHANNKAIKKGRWPLSDSASSKAIYERATKNPTSYRSPPQTSSLVSGRWDSGRGDRFIESSWRSSDSSMPIEALRQLSTAGRGRKAGPTQASWREKVSYATSSSLEDSRTSGGTLVGKNCFSHARNNRTDERTRVWRKRDSSSAGGGQLNSTNPF